MSLTNFSYPQIQKWYNSERREVRPDWCDTRGTANEVTFYENSLNQFTIDASNTSINNKKNLTLFTFANGVSIRMRYYWDGSYIQTETAYYDKDNNIINLDNVGSNLTTWSGRPLTLSEKYGLTQSNYTFYYSAPQVFYNGEEGATNPGFYSYKGDVIHLKDNASPYDPPQIFGVNEVFSRDNLGTYYDGFGGGIAVLSTDSDYQALYDVILNRGDNTPITPILPSEDPSEPGGGDDADPDYNPFSDPVDFPGLPTGGSAIASGFIRVYSPTSAQLQSLAGKLWGNDFINTIHKIMNDPMEAMISLHSVPFQIVGGSNANIEVGNFDTEVSAKTVTTQYYTLDCGNISLPEHWASALDYSPYTTVDIFIPFVGVRPLQIDDVMGRVLNLKYNIDVLTGCAIAMLKCGDSVLYTYNTQVHTEIPYTMSSYGRLVQSIIGVAGTAIGATAGGAGALIGKSIGGALGTAMTKHSDISRGGSLGGAVGVMGDFTPYLIIHRPIQSLASDFASKKGYPSNISATLSSVSGYTVVDKIHLTNIDCTDTERDEIHSLLKEGVII